MRMQAQRNWWVVKNDRRAARLKTSYEPQEATSMMAFCINGKSKSLSELFMTHPRWTNVLKRCAAVST